MLDKIIFNKIKQMKIVVIGDFMLDQYIYGKVSRISPEAPVPVVKFTSEKLVLGGAGNVSANIAGLGVYTHIIGRVGCDDKFLNLLALKNIDSRLMLRDGETIIKTRVMGNSHQQIVRIDREEISSPNSTQIKEILQNLAGLLSAGIDAVIISDYGKGFCSQDLCQGITNLCRTRGIKVFVDPKCKDWYKYANAFLVTPNISELSQATGEDIPNEDNAIVQEGRKLLAHYAIENLLVTRSEQGATLITKDGFVHCHADSVEVFDVSGAGDTMIATVATFSAAGLPLEDCVRIANTASQVVIGKVGTCPITAEELEEALLAKESPQKLKITDDYQTATKLCEKWKNNGQKIVFTNGCFDILHAGHIDSLRRTRQLGDRLIVGLNSDTSVSRLKGPNRPVNSQDARASVLSALEFVDLVVIFNEDTPKELLSLLRPDVLTKGGDYKPEEVVGREYAGEVVILPLLNGYSTTSIINKIGGNE